MAPRNVILWTLLPIIVVLVMTTSVQAQELTEVPASDILEQIENGEDIYLENIRIIGELNLSEIELKTVPIARSWEQIDLGLEEELKSVESKIKIRKSVFEDYVDFSNTQLKKDIDFSGTSFSDGVDFKGSDIGSYADFCGANFGGVANFCDAYFSSNAIFRSTEFNNVYFTGASFTNVSLNKSNFNSMNVEWSTLKDALVFDGPTYMRLYQYALIKQHSPRKFRLFETRNMK